jgi:transposase
MRASAYVRYDDAFRRDALALLERSDRTLFQVATELGMSPSTLRYWYNAEVAKKKKVKGRQPLKALKALTASEKQAETLEEENARLKRELEAALKKNAELEEDRAILKKAAAFFAKESE